MNTQFKKGVLELCVLSLLKHGDKYGYELADTVGKQIDVSEGTIYPLWWWTVPPPSSEA